MWIVRLALRRPYSFIVMALLILILSPIVILLTPVNFLPEINIPVISVIWQFQGLSAQEMTDRIVSNTERGLTTIVNDIEHTETQAMDGRAITKIFFHPTANLQTALSQVTAISQTALRQLPQGINPPLIIVYSASSVPIVQVGISSKTLPEQALNDVSVNFIRPQMTTVPGAAIPFPYGGKQRVVAVDIDTAAMQAKRLTPVDVVNAISAQNLILPSGTAKIGSLQYQVSMNGSPDTIAEINALPIKTQNGTTTYLRDVAHVRDGFSPQTNIVRQDGIRGTLLTVMKNGGASTLDIVKNIKETLKLAGPTLPEGVDMKALFDQSLFVRASIDGVLREALIAACLTAAMILLFLGNWRSTLIIAISIPLSILCSIIVLSALGESLNIMTLGGLALAVGILVDDATVTIENIDRHLAMGKPLTAAILDGASQIAVPAFVSTLCICIVFVPMFFLTGVAKFLFVPLAEAVVFAMLASYLLSRTLVPTMVMYLLLGHEHDRDERASKSRNPFTRFQLAFDRTFERVRDWYRSVLVLCLERRAVFLSGLVLFWVASLGVLYPWLGQDFFPSVDSGQFKLHVHADTGPRIDDTARLCDQVEAVIKQQIPVSELGTMIENVGLPYSGLNLSYSNSAPVGTGDADILVSLGEKHRPTVEYMRTLRAKLNEDFPGTEFYYLPTDMVSQILNFGLPAPIDIQIS